MPNTNSVLFLGGDSRSEYMIKELAPIYNVYSLGLRNTHTIYSLLDLLKECSIVICPVPFSKDKNTLYSNSVAQANAIATAEGAICEAIKMSPYNLHGSKCLVLGYGITDTPVLMAAKGHMRNEKPIVISVSTNDALGLNLKNIGTLISTKNMYFVPFGQDDYKKKPRSMVSDVSELVPTIEYALEGKQIQPIIKTPN